MPRIRASLLRATAGSRAVLRTRALLLCATAGFGRAVPRHLCLCPSTSASYYAAALDSSIQASSYLNPKTRVESLAVLLQLHGVNCGLLQGLFYELQHCRLFVFFLFYFSSLSFVSYRSTSTPPGAEMSRRTLSHQQSIARGSGGGEAATCASRPPATCAPRPPAFARDHACGRDWEGSRQSDPAEGGPAEGQPRAERPRLPNGRRPNQDLDTGGPAPRRRRLRQWRRPRSWAGRQQRRRRWTW